MKSSFWSFPKSFGIAKMRLDFSNVKFEFRSSGYFLLMNVWHYNPLLIRNPSWILTIHKARMLRKKSYEKKIFDFKKWVISIQTAGYNGARTVFSDQLQRHVFSSRLYFITVSTGVGCLPMRGCSTTQLCRRRSSYSDMLNIFLIFSIFYLLPCLTVW